MPVKSPPAFVHPKPYVPSKYDESMAIRSSNKLIEVSTAVRKHFRVPGLRGESKGAFVSLYFKEESWTAPLSRMLTNYGLAEVQSAAVLDDLTRLPIGYRVFGRV